MVRYNYDNQFSLENIPFGVVSTQTESTPQAATRVFGNVILISKLLASGALPSIDQQTRDALEEVSELERIFCCHN